MSERADLSRREFLGRAGAGVAAGLGAAAGVLPVSAAPAGPNRSTSAANKIILGIIGCHGMGSYNMRQLMSKPEVEVAALCDVDESRIPRDASAVE